MVLGCFRVVSIADLALELYRQRFELAYGLVAVIGPDCRICPWLSDAGQRTVSVTLPQRCSPPSDSLRCQHQAVFSWAENVALTA